ncbi:MAG: hypothetical protein K2K12_00780, partial [Clostridia bacterium]|nr:hypothetical protein [Clostridia bacterium]
SKEEGVTFTWTSSNTELVTVEGSELKINSIPAQETEVTITVTAKLGSVETPKEYKIKLGALNVTAAGTAADPFTVEEVLEICNTLASGKNYQKDGKDAQIFVKGYVTEKGEINGTYGLKNVYIGTENDANAKAILVYNINWDGALPKPDPIPSESPLAAGDYVIVRGYIKNYGGTYEIAQSGDYPVITAITKANDTTSDAERVTAALTAIPATLDEITKKGTTTLATTTDAKLAIKWELTDGADVATLTGNKLSVAALPTEDKTVTLKVTVTCGTESQDKTVTVLVKADDNNPATGWNKVTSASDLQDGATILLTYGNWAMGEVANNGNFMTAIKDGFDGTDITDSVLTITLEAASEGKFYLKVGDKYLSAPTAASNYVHLKDKQTDGTSEWTITINDDETATITPTKQSSNNRVLQFNANSGQERFACYTASQKNITIYIYS